MDVSLAWHRRTRRLAYIVSQKSARLQGGCRGSWKCSDVLCKTCYWASSGRICKCFSSSLWKCCNQPTCLLGTDYLPPCTSCECSRKTELLAYHLVLKASSLPENTASPPQGGEVRCRRKVSKTDQQSNVCLCMPPYVPIAWCATTSFDRGGSDNREFLNKPELPQPLDGYWLQNRRKLVRERKISPADYMLAVACLPAQSHHFLILSGGATCQVDQLSSMYLSETDSKNQSKRRKMKIAKSKIFKIFNFFLSLFLLFPLFFLFFPFWGEGMEFLHFIPWIRFCY